MAINKILKKAAQAYKREEAKPSPLKKAEQIDLSRIHEHLEDEGVPSHIGKKIHEIIHEEPANKEILGRAVAEALNHKKNGNITGESLTKIIHEAVNESEKGVSKDELKDLIKEVLKSELRKGELLKAYQPGKEQIEASTEEIEIPLPSIEKGGLIKRKYEEPGKEWATEELTRVNITYPLLFKSGKVHVYANIRFDPALQGLIYRVIEPQLREEEKKILNKIETTLVEELEVDFAALKTQTAERYLREKVDSVIEYYDMKISDRGRDLMDYYIYRDFIGLGKVEPMFQDPNIEDISCDGIKIPIYIYHRDPRFGSIKTNVFFKSEDTLNSFVMKIAQRCNRSISVADPLLDGALPDGSRVQATFGSGISMKGSNFTIRKFTKDPLTCIDLINYGTLNAEILAYLWLAIEHGKSILIAGPTASGKTTMLNSLSLFIRPELKIVSIEDTPELRLPHENWISQVARTGFGPESAAGKKLGEISLFDLLKASLRQRPDNIIVGEVRGKEAYVLFQQMATGHPGLSTIHAESMDAVVNRLRTPPIELPPSLVQHLDILIVLSRQRMRGKYMRRIKEIVEVIGYDVENDRLKVNTTYTWDPPVDKFEYSGKSSILKDAMEMIGSTPEGIYSEIERRMRVIKWMQTNGVRDYKNVGRVIAEYYQSPSALMDQIS